MNTKGVGMIVGPRKLFLIVVVAVAIASAVPGVVESSGSDLRRVGHRAVQIPGISDGPCRVHSYFSVVAFDSGEVVALNVWYSPQLFRFHPESSALESIAFTYPVGIPAGQYLGNEDDDRWRLRAHKGVSADQSFFMWTVKGWTEIDAENGELKHDAAVFSNRPVLDGVGRMPTRNARVCNMGADADNPSIGPERASLDYDPLANLVFVSMDHPEASALNELFQVYRLNTGTGVFEGRAQVSNTLSGENRQLASFISVDPVHRVVLMQYENPWESHVNRMIFAEYTPVSGDDVVTISNLQQSEDLNLVGHDEDIKYRPQWSKAAVFAEWNGRLRAIVGSSVHEQNKGNGSKHSFGLYLFDLGPVGGPLALSRPVAKVPLRWSIEDLEIVGDELIVSSRGLHIYDLGQVLAASGSAEAGLLSSYPLPYDTYEFDRATINGVPYLFLAAGARGLDIFQLAGNGDGVMDGAIDDDVVPVSLSGGAGHLLLETGGGLMHLGTPAMGPDGDLAVWGVTDNQREVIIQRPVGGKAEIVASTDDSLRSLGRPSINGAGDLVFYAGYADDDEAILSFDGTLHAIVERNPSWLWLWPPELSDTGDVVFGHQLNTGPRQISLRRNNTSITGVFTEDSVYRFDAGDEDTVFSADYDIAPNGDVAFNRYSSAGAFLAHFDGATVTNVFDQEVAHDHLRLATNSFATIRTYSNEISKLMRIGLGTPALEVARRRQSYNGHGFGNFGHAAAASNGDVAFAAISFAGSELQVEDLGDWLHFYDASDPQLPGTLCKPTDLVDGRSVTTTGFVDSFNDAGTVTFLLQLRDGSDQLQQAIVGMAYPMDLIFADGFESGTTDAW